MSFWKMVSVRFTSASKRTRGCKLQKRWRLLNELFLIHFQPWAKSKLAKIWKRELRKKPQELVPKNESEKIFGTQATFLDNKIGWLLIAKARNSTSKRDPKRKLPTPVPNTYLDLCHFVSSWCLWLKNSFGYSVDIPSGICSPLKFHSWCG